MPAPAICGSLHRELLFNMLQAFLEIISKSLFFICNLFREEDVREHSGKRSRSCAQRLFPSPSSTSRPKDLLLDTLPGGRGKVAYGNSPACPQTTLWHPFVWKPENIWSGKLMKTDAVQICCDLHALRKPRNKVMDVAGLLEPSRGDL